MASLGGAPSGGGGALGGAGGHAGSLAGGGEGGAGNSAGDHAGEGGESAGGAGGCSTPFVERISTNGSDTWIDSSKPSATHGNEALLYVDSAAERRALLSMTVDAAPPGALLRSASLTLTLVENADTTPRERRLALHALTRDFEELRATWLNYGNGSSRKWQTPGADFGPAVAEVRLPASTSSGKVTFDVTGVVSALFSENVVPLSLVVLEVGSQVTTPSALAFGSGEGDASSAPSLAIQYCPP
jgi:hypothetical protein